MITAWAHLPNAKYIDRILEDVKINPDKWSAVKWSVVYDAAWDAAYGVAVYDAAWKAARVAVYDAASPSAWVSARDAILALIAWDDCGELLNADPEKVQILALLGDEKAILLHPACVALQKEIQ